MPPRRVKDTPWLYGRDVAPNMDKPKLEGETNTEFLVRCFAEDERFHINGKAIATPDHYIPSLPKWRLKANRKSRANRRWGKG